jgi:hypothetical protein
MPPTEPTYFYITTKNPSGTDAVGAIEEGHYTVVDGMVTLTDAAGVPMGIKGRAELKPGLIRW